MSSTKRISLTISPTDSYSLYGSSSIDIDSNEPSSYTLQSLYSEAVIELSKKLQVPNWSEGDTIQVYIGRLWFTYQYLNGVFCGSSAERSNTINLVSETLTYTDVAALWAEGGKVNVLVKDGSAVGNRRV